MADRIQLSVAVETGKATTDLKQFGDTTKRTMAEVQNTSTSSIGAISRSTQTMGTRFAGAGAAISSANAALQLMGRQGPPALQTLAAGAASVAVSGFGPMSLAIVGVTTALSLFLQQSEEAPPKINAVSESLERQEATLKRLGAAADAASLKLRAVTSGRSVDEQRNAEELRQARFRLSQIERGIETRTARLRELESGSSGLAPGIALLEVEQIERSLKRLNRDRMTELEIIRRISDIRSDTLETEKKLRRETELRKEAEARAPAGGFRAVPRTMSRSELINRMISDFNRGQLSLEDRAVRIGDDRGVADFMREIDAQIDADRTRSSLAERLRQQNFTMAGMFGLGEPVPEAAGPVVSAEAQSRANLIVNNMASGFSQALMTQDYSGVGRAMALSFVDQILQAVAAGALQGLGVESTIASGFQSLGSSLGGGSAETAAAATGGR